METERPIIHRTTPEGSQDFQEVSRLVVEALSGLGIPHRLEILPGRILGHVPPGSAFLQVGEIECMRSGIPVLVSGVPVRYLEDFGGAG